MFDAFISYTSHDRELAKFVYETLRRHGFNVFMAEVSLRPGVDWPVAIKNALSQSRWVIFLASARACAAPYVLQEIGAAIWGGKKLVPIVWDITPDKLPGWAKNYQAITLQSSIPEIHQQVEQIAKDIHADKQSIKAERDQGLLIAGTVVLGLLMFSGGK
ncbi:MAG: toll/interleukin-1 receptor domain-containing protein [Phycisphaerales bacterium]|nr:toll/interleukin-1 receptor domain-containing protein [Phycisphaerales bacterium]